MLDLLILNTIYSCLEQNNKMSGKSSDPDSPLIQNALTSIQGKKKPSKRIKKIANSIFKSKTKETNASRDRDHQKIIKILETRSVPDFMIQFVKNKRIFNVNSLRKINVGREILNTNFKTTEYLGRQEKELIEMIKVEKEWKESREKLEFMTPIKKVKSHLNYSGGIQTFTKISIESDEEPSEIQQQEYPEVSMFNLEDDIGLDFMRSTINNTTDIFSRLY